MTKSNGVGERAGQVVAITGGGTGIGREVARLFIEKGASVIINGRRSEVLEQTARELDIAGDRVATVAGDVSDPETGKRIVETALRRFGGLNVLVNNAGFFSPKAFVDHDASDIDWYFDTIFKGTFYTSQAAVPELIRSGGGAIVNVGSMWAERAIGATPASAYSAAKAGVHSLTRSLAIELAEHNIRINAVAPAVVETPVYETYLGPEKAAEALPALRSLHPLGRNGTAEDVAQAILYLAGHEAAWVTGTILSIDGGVLAGSAS